MQTPSIKKAIRFDPPQLERVRSFAAARGFNEAEAIRTLVEIGLAGNTPEELDEAAFKRGSAKALAQVFTMCKDLMVKMNLPLDTVRARADTVVAGILGEQP